jgi:hypothetical protein
MHQPVMSRGNACSTCMHKPVRCMHRPVMSQADACTYCMGSKDSSRSQIYLYSSYFGHNCLNIGTLESCGPVGNTEIIITKPLKSLIFLFWAITFELQKIQKWLTPFCYSCEKTRWILKWYWHFCNSLISVVSKNSSKFSYPGNTKGGSITVPLTSCLTCLESAVWQLKWYFNCSYPVTIFICKTD